MNTVLTSQKAFNEILRLQLKEDGIYGEKTHIAAIKLDSLLYKLCRDKGYPYEENMIVGIRMNDQYTNLFTDWLVIKTHNVLELVPFSTKPGIGAVITPHEVDGVKGVACLAEGYYRNVYRYRNNGWSGLEHLHQVEPVSVIRDNNYDKIINRKVYQTGLFGINFHSWYNASNKWYWNIPVVSTIVRGKYSNLSEGCQVMTADVHEKVFVKIKATWDLNAPIDYYLIHINEIRPQA